MGKIFSLYLIMHNGASPIKLPNCCWSSGSLFMMYGKKSPFPDVPSQFLGEDGSSDHLLDGSGTACKASYTHGPVGPCAGWCLYGHWCRGREPKATPQELRGERCSDIPGGNRSADHLLQVHGAPYVSCGGN